MQTGPSEASVELSNARRAALYLKQKLESLEGLITELTQS